MAFTQVCQPVIDLGPEMELRIRGARGGVQWVRVAEHVTLGQSAANDLVIDDQGVNLIHARVVTGTGGRPELRCVGMAKLALGDGTWVDRLDLTPGITFGIGAAMVECVRVGKALTGDVQSRACADVDSPVRAWAAASPEEAAVKAAPDKGADVGATVDATMADVPVAVELPRLVVCPTCYRDMTGVPSVARFCPKCGVQLPARDAAGFLIPPEESSPLYPVYHALREELGAKLADETPQVASSLIILAYANAMLNLGWRYEHGRGTMRNVEEAARCYAKAGKLAEAWGK
jgi:hypothetical protein